MTVKFKFDWNVEGHKNAQFNDIDLKQLPQLLKICSLTAIIIHNEVKESIWVITKLTFLVDTNLLFSYFDESSGGNVKIVHNDPIFLS